MASGADTAPRERRVESDTATLAVYELGEPGPTRPTVVFVHGWPDSAAVWDLVGPQLADCCHVVTYDTRGVGRSTAATSARPYALERLVLDITAVIDAVRPGARVHLVGHDWGSVQGWEYVVGPDAPTRVASFTSLSGPSLDHLAVLLRRRLARPTARNLAPAVAQGAKSAYTVVLSTPGVRTALWRLGFGRVFRRWLQASEHIAADGGYPPASLASDAIASVGLYRTNIWRRLRRPSPRTTAVPVQLIVAARDRYVSPRSFEDLEDIAPDLRRRAIDAGHWSLRTHPAEIAELIIEFVDDIERRSSSPRATPS